MNYELRIMNTKENLKEFLEKETQNKIDDENINLIERGILDSFTMIKLIGFIEKDLGVKLDMEKLTPDNFNSIKTIIQLLNYLMTQ